MVELDNDELLYEARGAIAYLTLNRPERMNALTPAMRAGLDLVSDDFDRRSDLRVLIVTGAGDKAFCAGADLRATIPKLSDAAATPGGIFQDPTRRMFSRVKKPIIAAINGVCVAGGTEMLLGTDLRVAATHATFGLPEPRWGLIAAGGSHVRLPRQIPYCFAMEILLTGRRLSAEEALRFSLINRVVAPDRLLAECEMYAEKICRNGPLAVRAAKEAVLAAANASWEEGFFVESLIASKVFGSEDAGEGVKAFAEKREPDFKGR